MGARGVAGGWGVVAIVALCGCGANVVFGDAQDGGGGSGGGGTGATTSTSTGAFMTTSTGATFCTTHEECGDGNICEFSTGQCIPACDESTPCPSGYSCISCATGSCPDCADCRSGCVLGPVACGSHDDCGVTLGDDVCVFALGVCAQRCGPASPPCPPAYFCNDCATSSCPGCDDCVGACVQGIK